VNGLPAEVMRTCFEITSPAKINAEPCAICDNVLLWMIDPYELEAARMIPTIKPTNVKDIFP